MTTHRTEPKTNGLAAASMQVVSSTRKWATVVRDLSLTPAMEIVEQNRATEPALVPWLEMIRAAHDWMLDTWEVSASQLIDHGCALLDLSRSSVEPARQAGARPNQVATDKPAS